MTATLADLQTEREKLNAHKAREDYQHDLAATIDHPAARRAGQQARAALLRMLDTLEHELLTAIEGATDETEIHYRQADTLHAALAGMAGPLRDATAAAPVLGESLRRGLRPRDLITVSEWADRHRWLVTGTNAPGRWRTELTPYLREIMDSLSEHSPVRQVAFIKSAGVGGSECIFNWLGYIMQHLRNQDVLLVVPTLELRDRSFNPRIAKLLAETPTLAELTSQATRDRSNRADLLEFGARARLIKAGSNSPDSLRADHLPYVICDEIDAFPWEAGAEGDPMTLIENRQRTFSRAKTYLVSTPTVAGRSRIDLAYQRSDQRRYHVPCPLCGHRQVLEFGSPETPHGLKWRVMPANRDTGEVAARVDQVLDAWYQCRHCQGRIEEGHKTEMLAAGRWLAARPERTQYRGYHINALYAPIGLGLTWKHVAQKWLDCQGDTAELKAFVNTYLGEVWTEEGQGLEGSSLLLRLEEYPAQGLPLPRITAGVDVQKNRLECTLVGWAEGEQAWVLEHLILDGDTTQADVWNELAEVLPERGVHLACIDSGYNTSFVYAFCERRRWAIPTKGVTGAGRPLIEDEPRRRARLRKRWKRAIQSAVEPIGVDQGKAILYSRLRQTTPGAGYVHFPAGRDHIDAEYFDQLAAEKLVTRVQGSRPIAQWVQIRARNEALDCLLLALAACRLCGAFKSPPAPTETAPAPVPESPSPAKKPWIAPRKPGGWVKGWK